MSWISMVKNKLYTKTSILNWLTLILLYREVLTSNLYVIANVVVCNTKTKKITKPLSSGHTGYFFTVMTRAPSEEKRWQQYALKIRQSYSLESTSRTGCVFTPIMRTPSHLTTVRVNFYNFHQNDELCHCQRAQPDD